VLAGSARLWDQHCTGTNFRGARDWGFAARCHAVELRPQLILYRVPHQQQISFSFHGARRKHPKLQSQLALPLSLPLPRPKIQARLRFQPATAANPHSLQGIHRCPAPAAPGQGSKPKPKPCISLRDGFLTRATPQSLAWSENYAYLLNFSCYRVEPRQEARADSTHLKDFSDGLHFPTVSSRVHAGI
jgi:hypothetical protein